MRVMTIYCFRIMESLRSNNPIILNNRPWNRNEQGVFSFFTVFLFNCNTKCTNLPEAESLELIWVIKGSESALISPLLVYGIYNNSSITWRFSYRVILQNRGDHHVAHLNQMHH